VTRPDLMLLQLWLTLTDRPARRGRERGDVPGWVMVTIMSAALVVALITIAGPKLSSLFSNAVDSTSKTKAPTGP
jgi:hypothetical protein